MDGSAQPLEGAVWTALTAEPMRRSEKLSEQIYLRILHQIVSGGLREGQRFPPETELAELFGVSRSTVRDALLRLRRDGLVAARRGSGNYVGHAPNPDLSSLVASVGPAELTVTFELRMALEGDAAALAAERRTDHGLAAIEASLEEHRISIAKARLSKIDALVSLLRADVRFHNTVAHASGNPMFWELVESLNGSIRNSWLLCEALYTEALVACLHQVQAEHTAVYEAIRARRPDAARQAMRDHLRNGCSRFIELEDSHDG